MNCKELRKDIDKLRADYEAATNPNNGSVSSNNILKTAYINAKNIGSFEDYLLNKYFNDFVEKNSDVFPFEFDEKIEGFYNGIQVAIKLSDNTVFVGGNNESRILMQDDNGKWGYGECIKGLEQDNTSVLVQLSDDTLFVGGVDNARILKRGEDQEWKVYNRVWGFGESRFNPEVHTAIKLSDDMTFVGGGGWLGEARMLKIGDNGRWKFDEEIKGFDNGIRAAVQLSDDMVFVGGKSGEARMLRRNGDEWEFSEKINGFKDDILVAIQLSDDTVFVGGNGGEAMMLKNDDNGEWVFDREEVYKFGNGNTVWTATQLSDNMVFAGCGGGNGILKRGIGRKWTIDEEVSGNSIRTIVQLSDGVFFVGGGDGWTRTLKRDTSFETFKKHLKDIANKK